MSKPIVLRLHTHEASTMTHLASPLSIRTDISDGCSFLSSCSTSDPLNCLWLRKAAERDAHLRERPGSISWILVMDQYSSGHWSHLGKWPSRWMIFPPLSLFQWNMPFQWKWILNIYTLYIWSQRSWHEHSVSAGRVPNTVFLIYLSANMSAKAEDGSRV